MSDKTPLTIEARIEQLVRKYGTLRATSRAIGVDVGYLSRLWSGEKINPSEETLGGLGLRRLNLYEAVIP